ncbi:translation initiation factor [Nostoc sp. UHCC 0251]|uniref:translation initiation factor n=1 Tax=Nostoc sp. UHCC 0251 TaxID=3110240 RepID=UPI002B20FED9|nr:translation initiation factor [Nostoc sp. UHCC 0251]MEA5625550.1 translation initiation factor [Nostoc sp. UHCC 0251]
MVDDFLRKAKDLFFGGKGDQAEDTEYRDGLRPAVDDRNVRPASEDPYGDPADIASYGDVRPASEDPYGDPGDISSYGNVRPASEDPYGDPADQEFGDVRPASEDPYGDPADQDYRR